MATGTSLSSVFPLGSRLNECGRLEVGGCDTIELASEFGTPVYVVAEDDMRARARAFVQAGQDAGHEDFHVAFAAKAFPCTAVLALFAQEGLWCDVASGGELHLALNAGFAPARVVLHGNAKSRAELRTALERGVGLIVVDNFDEIERLRSLLGAGRSAPAEDRDASAAVRPAHAPAGGAAHVPPRQDAHVRPAQASHATPAAEAHAPLRTGRSEIVQHVARSSQDVLVRVTPDVQGDTHEKISTGQADSKFGFSMAQAHEAIVRLEAIPGLSLRGVHAHIGSQLLELEPFRREVAELATLGDFAVWDLGGGLGVRYTERQREPPSIEEYVSALVAAAHEHGFGPRRRLLVEPGRALCANACVTLYTVESVKHNVSRWVAVDGGMSDNLRPMLYSAPYEAQVADRFGGSSRCVLAGKHCESGDVIARDTLLADPRPGDVIVTPATGAYGYAMANNYNGVPRAPVVFCRDGDARLVVRRDSYEDLQARDVR